MDFGSALMHLKAGRAVARQRWGSQGITLVMVPSLTIKLTQPEAELKALPYLAQSINGVLTAWAKSDLDVFADDWQVVIGADDVMQVEPTPPPTAPEPETQEEQPQG